MEVMLCAVKRCWNYSCWTWWQLWLCRWVPIKTVDVPSKAAFTDYSGMAFSEERFGIVSQVNHCVPHQFMLTKLAIYNCKSCVCCTLFSVVVYVYAQTLVDFVMQQTLLHVQHYAHVCIDHPKKQPRCEPNPRVCCRRIRLCGLDTLILKLWSFEDQEKCITFHEITIVTWFTALLRDWVGLINTGLQWR